MNRTLLSYSGLSRKSFYGFQGRYCLWTLNFPHITEFLISRRQQLNTDEPYFLGLFGAFAIKLLLDFRVAIDRLWTLIFPHITEYSVFQQYPKSLRETGLIEGLWTQEPGHILVFKVYLSFHFSGMFPMHKLVYGKFTKKAIFLFESSKSPRPPKIAIRPIKTLRKFRFWIFLSNQIVFNLFRKSPNVLFPSEHRT